MITYDTRFNSNEWFVIIGLCVGIGVVKLLPARFSRLEAVLFFMTGVFSGFFYDHSLSVQPVSYYDVNDQSEFEWMDFLSYWMYGPFSYMFFYVYDYLRLKPRHAPLYALVGSAIGIGVEAWGVSAGLYHYNHGYIMWYSIPIYLLTQSAWIGLYYRVGKAKTPG